MNPSWALHTAARRYCLERYAYWCDRYPKLAGSVILSGNDGDDAKDYQEKQVRTAIREAAK